MSIGQHELDYSWGMRISLSRECSVSSCLFQVMLNTRRVIRQALQEDLPIILVINKMDRLMLELKIPPKDAYFKLKHTVEEVNTMIHQIAPHKSESYFLSPELGNVVFASGKHGWSFTLPSFAHIYSEMFGECASHLFLFSSLVIALLTLNLILCCVVSHVVHGFTLFYVFLFFSFFFKFCCSCCSCTILL